MSQAPDDDLSRARVRFTAVDAERAASMAELAELRAGGGGTDTKSARERLSELEARVPALEREWNEAHAAFGRALLDEFAQGLGALSYPVGDTHAADELRMVARNLRRACLVVLAEWPELQDEARQRLRVVPFDEGRLQG